MTSPPGPAPGAFHIMLRETTRREHQLIDAKLSLLDLTAASTYRIFLNIHYAALRSLAVAWRREDHQEFGGLLDRLRSDLAAMGAAVDERIRPLDAALAPAHRLGVSYVIRGSRLGSKVLRRRVPPHLSTSYLAHEPALSWPVFLAQLELQAGEIGSHAQAQIIDGAKLAFGAFEAAADGAAVPKTQGPG